MKLSKLFECEDFLLEMLKPSNETFDELTMTGEYDLNKSFNQQEWFSLNSKEMKNFQKTKKFYRVCREHLNSFRHDVDEYVRKNKFVEPKSVKSNNSITQSGLINSSSLSAYINFKLIDGTPLIIRISDHIDINKNHEGKTYYIKLGRYLSGGIKHNIDTFIEQKMGIKNFNNKKFVKKPEVVYLNKKFQKSA